MLLAPAPQRRLAPALLLALLANAAPGLAQGPDGSAAGEPAAVSNSGSSRGIRVLVEGEPTGLDTYSIQRAVEAELGVTVYGDAHQSAVGTLRVVAKGRDELRMVYEGNDGRYHERTVRLPADPEKRLETVALVAGNLVRDETGELIEELKPVLPETASAPEPEPTSTAAPDASTEPAPEPAPAVSQRAVAAPTRTPSTGITDAAPLTSASLNLSLYHPLSVHSNSHELQVNCELGGAYSYVGRVQGAAFTLFVSRLRHGFAGLQLAGLFAFSTGASRGASLAGLFAQQQGDLDGVLMGGLATRGSGSIRGLQAAGLASLRKGPSHGVQLAGLVSQAGDIQGAQLSGALSLGKRVHGFQLAGLVNLADSLEGAMLAGVANFSRQPARGAQLGLVNVAPELTGLQLGLVNVSRGVRGAQIGVVNVAEDVSGTSLGLVSLAKNGRQQLVLWSSPGHALANIGAKFQVGPLYTLLAFGYEPDDEQASQRILPGAALGLHFDVEPAFFELDVLYQSEHSTDFDEQRHLVSLRPQLGVALLPYLGVFGGAAFETGPEGDAWRDDVRVRGFGGVQFF